MKNMTNNTMYTVRDSYTFLYSFKVTLVISFPSIFSLHSSTSLLINLFLFKFYNLNILLHHMIYHIYIHNC